MPHRISSVCTVALAALALAAPVAATQGERLAGGVGAPAAPPAATDRVIVVWEDGVARPDRTAAREGADTELVRTLGDRRFQLLRTEPGQAVGDALAALRADPAVRTAARETYDVPHATTSDPLLPQLWGLQNTGAGVAGVPGAVAGADVNALAAWDRTRGVPGVVVADLDSGYRFDHPDLGPVAWSNPADPPNGADDDGNGIVDDAHGADFVGASANAPAVDGDPTDDNLLDGGHGVHTAGTIGAAGNDGVGMSGVAQDARLMPLRVCGILSDPRDPDDDGMACPSTAQIQAINYAGAHGARVANMSLGGTSFNAAVRDAFAANPNVLFVISAGNDGLDNEAVPHYPCNYEPQTSGIAGAVDNVVCVAATDQADQLAGFSDWGARSVDLGAPGTEILSAYPSFVDPVADGFEAADFGTKWAATGRQGFARTNEAPLTSFGISDSPGRRPTPSTTVESTSAPFALPAGSGACTLTQTRVVDVGFGASYRYAVLADGVPAFESNPVTASGTFATVPIRGLGGRSVQVRFRYVTGPSPSTGDGVWLDDVLLECYAPLAAAPGYELLDGTSMAAPHVSGAAALLLSLNPAASAAQVRSALLTTVDLLPSLGGRTSSGGRLDAASALDEIRQPDTRIVSAPPRTTRSRRAVFVFARADVPLGAGFECQLDGGAFAACASPVAYTGVGGGRHAFAVRARSPKGVVTDPSPAAASWTVTQCKVPRLRGRSLSRARRALRRAHCALGKVVRPRAARTRRGARRRAAARPLVVGSSRPRAGAVRVDGARVRIVLTPKPRARPRARRPARRRRGR